LLCKHISFIICKVLGIYDKNIFIEKRIKKDILEKLRNVRDNEHMLIKNINKKFREENIRKDEVCPICYDDLEVSFILNCPVCKNHVHEKCMKVWLENYDTCVYCRSTEWREFKDIE
jgi:hypothetical protein